jgi:hypothetical protein
MMARKKDNMKRVWQTFDINEPYMPHGQAFDPERCLQKAVVIAKQAELLQMSCRNRLPRMRLAETSANLRKALDQFDRACGL